MAATAPQSAGTSNETTPRQPLWLRCEKKPFEHRSALTPTTAKKLIENNFDIFVERDPQRIFDDQEFEDVGCKLVAHNTWPSAPVDVPIIGLKELPESTDPLPHTHIQFAHCYKHQAGWNDVLRRFAQGSGTLYDLEFLEDPVTHRRVAAFGFHAGFAGAAAGALAFAAQQKEGGEGVLRGLEPYKNEGDMVREVGEALEGTREGKKGVRVLVIGALGRCGSGAVDLFRKAGVAEENIVKWDMAETAKGGPFQEILDVDIFVNCIYLSQPIPKFITSEFIAQAGEGRRLGVVVDVSCDTTNPHNPIPIYSINTTFPQPTVEVDTKGVGKRATVISIDHLPTLLPREASEQFAGDLLPSLLKLPQRKTAEVWTGAERLFREKMEEARAFDEEQGIKA
ncbi:saccharopine dehydrogenase (NAD+, L-lysine forming) [Cryptococcus wingfieldii CBS 7118]|uniref:Saccharopine dehydrogenase [NAD(+), L-lysine-forming] n=1 Tax=Cryptococcus wingfieldii CBS 7118 TaxID=1295528 RepID=A0A1E3HJN3_9TREE|nr:saccharopine dehydrogenase (NAD+, L-lysine forming) [Cryptococcus wingfieldii CBS 7118]ODN75631.1 saccharopine dehydrogenase (NAD+, L-lysine forming) [Cryptococcus wingfieldii CBS 7118]